MKTLDIRQVPTEYVLLVWLSPVIAIGNYDIVIMTRKQNKWLAGYGEWIDIRGIPIQIKRK